MQKSMIFLLLLLIFFIIISQLFSFLLSFRFVFKNNGVLFENDLIQIGVKSEYRQNLGRLGLFYGNKTQSALEVCQPHYSFAFEKLWTN